MQAYAGQRVWYRSQIEENTWLPALVLRDGSDAQNGINLFVLDQKPFIQKAVLSESCPKWRDAEWVETAYLAAQVGTGNGGQWRPMDDPDLVALREEVAQLRAELAALQQRSGKKEKALA